MFGKILSIRENTIYLENTSGKAETSIIGIHVVFNDTHKQLVGEILNISVNDIEILLIGEIKNGEFVSGVMKKPEVNASCRIITKKELECLLGSQDYSNKENILFGNSVIYDGFNITAKVNDFFGNHFAVLGNTGSGKSCCVARLLQNVFCCNDGKLPLYSHFVVFDIYGEYRTALEGISRLNPNLGFKNYTTEISRVDNNIVNIPSYFLGVDDLALLMDVDDPTLIPVLENTLRLCYVFNSKDEKTVQYKDFIIATTVMDILSSGKTTTQLRDQIVAVLSKYNTNNISLDSIIHQPGYNRTLRQCLLIDNQGKMNSIQLVIEFLKPFTNFDLNSLDITPNFIYTLDDLAHALDFSLVNEGILNSDIQYSKLNKLKVRLNAIINSDYKKFFEFSNVVSKEDWIKKFFTSDRGTSVQIVNMNFNYIDDRMAKILTKIYAKIFFDYLTNLSNRASFPIHMILEEAHRYVMNDSDLNVLGYNIFDRITKEGRKYGIILGVITQRPSELSTTSLSQCANFIVLKLYYPDDLEIIKKITANVNTSTIDKIKTLRPGMALCFGTSFKIPLLASFALPNPMPKSTSVDIGKVWFGENVGVMPNNMNNQNVGVMPNMNNNIQNVNNNF